MSENDGLKAKVLLCIVVCAKCMSRENKGHKLRMIYEFHGKMVGQGCLRYNLTNTVCHLHECVMGQSTGWGTSKTHGGRVTVLLQGRILSVISVFCFSLHTA